MKKQLLTLCALFALGAGASENLVPNGNFAEGLNGYRYLKDGNAVLHTVKDGVLVITGDEKNANSKGYVSAIAPMAKLTPGKKYLIECQIRSTDFIPGEKCDYGMLLINKNWKGSAGVRRFKITNDNKWHSMKKVVAIPANWSNVNAVLFVCDSKGSLDFTNVKVTEVK